MILFSKDKILLLATEELEDFSAPTKYNDCTIWRDKDGHLHREDGDGPAYESESSKVWWKHGKQHREDGPAIDNVDCKGWLINGKYHRDDGPAFINSQGDKCWYLNGLQSTEEAVRALGKMK